MVDGCVRKYFLRFVYIFHKHKIYSFNNTINVSKKNYFISIKNCAKIPSKLGINVAYESKDKIYPSLKDLIFSLKTGAQNEMKFSRSDYFEKEAKECDFCPYKIICKGEIA